ncbi:hypothetical protein Pmani_011318 [Petrolisthes manimaculis]|uniref:Uncharacterized protein n=1 Tax=Petrolisthes manimaculis TaxID=1843537 RepID=A0AAE1UBN1_9EUCA|nr:hypothetical protein Pmani_011318 [Petrolisthes manimaculis]
MWIVLVRAWLLCLAIAVFIHPSHQQDDPLVMEKLIMIADTTINICVNNHPENTDAYALTYTIPNVIEEMKEVDIDILTADTCIEFQVINLDDNWKNKPINLVLNALKKATDPLLENDEELATTGNVEIATFPGIPANPLTCENAANNALRFAVDTTTTTLLDTLYYEEASEDKVLITCASTDKSIQYFLNTGADSSTLPTSVQQCMPGAPIICTEPLDITSATFVETEGPTLNDVTLHYTDGSISIASTSKNGAESLEVIVNEIVYTGSLTGNFGPTLTDYTPSTETLSMMMFGVDNENMMVEYNTTTITDCIVEGNDIGSGTMEVRWHKNDVKDYYSLSRAKSIIGGDTGTISMHCPDDINTCFGYFLDVPNGDHKVTIAPGVLNEAETEVEGDPTQQIESLGITMANPSLKLDMKANEIYMKWNSDGVSCQVSVCVQASVKKEYNLQHYQLIMLDSQGHHRKVQGASNPSPDTLCFSGLTLDTNTFDLSQRVTILFNRRDELGREVLSTGQEKVFLIAPRVETMTRNSGKVSWNNPGQYTYTVTRPNLATPLVSNLTCNPCTHFFTVGSEKREDKLMVETEESTVRIVAEIPVPLTTSTGM